MNLCKESWRGASPLLEPEPLARNQKHLQRGLFSRHKTETTLHDHCRLQASPFQKRERTPQRRHRVVSHPSLVAAGLGLGFF